jgi:hypothetical protein
MRLTELPLEIFQAITTETVSLVGVCDAVKLRLVSSIYSTTMIPYQTKLTVPKSYLTPKYSAQSSRTPGSTASQVSRTVKPFDYNGQPTLHS